MCEFLSYFSQLSLISSNSDHNLVILKHFSEGVEYEVMQSLFQNEAKKDFEFSVATFEVTYLRSRMQQERDITEFDYLLRKNGYTFVRSLEHDNVYDRKGFTPSFSK